MEVVPVFQGVIGDRCDKCDRVNIYEGDPVHDTCFYDMAMDYRFTFSLNGLRDWNKTDINWKMSPVPKPDLDVDLEIFCSKAARVIVTFRKVTTEGMEEKILLTKMCDRSGVRNLGRVNFSLSQ